MTETEELRAEIAALRKEVAELRGDRAVHHYHHQAAPAPLYQPPLSPSIPSWPGYFPATSGGVVQTSAEPFYNGLARQ